MPGVPDQSTEEWGGGGGEEYYDEGNGAEPGEMLMVVMIEKLEEMALRAERVLSTSRHCLAWLH